MQRLTLDASQRRHDRSRRHIPAFREADEEGPSIIAVESTADEPASLEPVEDAAQRRWPVTQTALQLSDRVRATVREQREHVRFTLGHAEIRKQRFKSHARGVCRPLQLDHHKRRELVSAPASSAPARRGGHRLTILRDGIVRIARYLDVWERVARPGSERIQGW